MAVQLPLTVVGSYCYSAPAGYVYPMKRIGKAVVVLGVILALAGCRHEARPQETAPRTAAAQVSVSLSKPVVSPPKHVATPLVARGCNKPAPTSARGFARMFAAVPTKQWGAADVSISLPLPDGRVLWLYGDTFSAGRFVHSSAIVQNRGCLHVVNGGAQLLPNVDAKHIYWIRSAELSGDGTSAVIITARAITLTGKGTWDFKDGGYDQEMVLELDEAGNAAYTIPAKYGWALVSPLGPGLHTAAPDAGPMYVYGPHHFGYARNIHPEFKLASGKHLYTTCQNWDDGKKHTLADYRPIFTER